MKNMKMKAKVDKLNIPVGKQVLAAVHMLANQFKEDFSLLLVTAEVCLS